MHKFLVNLGWLELKFPDNFNINGRRTYAELSEYAIQPYVMKIQTLSDNRRFQQYDQNSILINSGMVFIIEI